MDTVPVKPDKKNPVRIAAGRKNIQQRADYQVRDQLQDARLPVKATPHDLKIAQYRDRLMTAVAGKIPHPLFDQLDRRSVEFMDKLPDNTEIARYSDFCQYVEYCVKVENPPLPFHDYAVDAYLSHLMAQGRKRSAIDRHISSLVAWADILELDDPRKAFKVKMRIAQIRKKVKNKSRQAEGLRVDHLIEALEQFNPDVPRDCQDIALLYVGFETLCRQSELVRFDWEDLRIDADGSSVLELDWHKTDQEGEGTVLYLSRNTTDLLLGWQRVSGRQSGAIFRGIYSSGKMGDRLSARGVARCFKRTATRLGLASSVFSGHSNRVGAAQEMVERNIDVAKIMLSGRWKNIKMITQYAKRIQAKRSGMADLTHQLNWDAPKAVEPAEETYSPPQDYLPAPVAHRPMADLERPENKADHAVPIQKICALINHHLAVLNAESEIYEYHEALEALHANLIEAKYIKNQVDPAALAESDRLKIPRVAYYWYGGYMAKLCGNAFGTYPIYMWVEWLACESEVLFVGHPVNVLASYHLCHRLCLLLKATKARYKKTLGKKGSASDREELANEFITRFAEGITGSELWLDIEEDHYHPMYNYAQTKYAYTQR